MNLSADGKTKKTGFYFSLKRGQGKIRVQSPCCLKVDVLNHSHGVQPHYRCFGKSNTFSSRRDFPVRHPDFRGFLVDPHPGFGCQNLVFDALTGASDGLKPVHPNGQKHQEDHAAHNRCHCRKRQGFEDGFHFTRF